MKKLLALLALSLAFSTAAHSQSVALKTNLFYGAYTLTPNLGIELGLCDHFTLDLSCGYNPWNHDGSDVTNKKLVHLLSELELRYWFCSKFNGWFLGAHGLGTIYNISGHNLPALFGDGGKELRYEGHGYGGGISVGYQFILARHWNLELNVGGGYARMHYDKYDAAQCGMELVSDINRDYWGITRAGVSLLYIF